MKRMVIGLLLLACLGSAAFGDQGVTLRALCYNIHHGQGVDRRLDLKRIARVILSVQPDLVALQEVDRKVARTGGVDQPAELARLTGMHVAFGANIQLQGGQYGNAVLSRFPITSKRNHLLPNVNAGEQRGVLVAEIGHPKLKQPLRLLATHFDHRPDDSERVLSAKAVNKLASQSKQPTLLMGDLNDVIGSDPLTVLDKDWRRTNEKPLPTVAVDTPRRQIDFILYRPADRWTVKETRVLDEAIASDHRAIFAVLELQ